jgi:hypothetical protein
MVGVAGQDSQGAVDLFGEYDTSKLMWEGQTAERKEKIGALACCNGPPIGGTDSEHKALRAPIANAPDLPGKLFRGVLLAAAIQQNGIGRCAAWLAIQPVEDFCLGVEELGIAGDVPGSTFDIIGEQAIRSLGFGTSTALSDRSKGDLHWASETLKIIPQVQKIFVHIYLLNNDLESNDYGQRTAKSTKINCNLSLIHIYRDRALRLAG